MSETDVTLAWIEIYGLTVSKGTVKQERKILQCRTALISGYKQERFYNVELLCGDTEENDILV
jgi:hypothetical protein